MPSLIAVLPDSARLSIFTGNVPPAARAEAETAADGTAGLLEGAGNSGGIINELKRSVAVIGWVGLRFIWHDNESGGQAAVSDVGQWSGQQQLSARGTRQPESLYYVTTC